METFAGAPLGTLTQLQRPASSSESLSISPSTCTQYQKKKKKNHERERVSENKICRMAAQRGIKGIQ